MWEKIKNFGNRLWNTVMIAPRVAWTAVNTVSDTVNTFVALPKDALDVISNTTKDVRDVFINSWTKWKRYHRVWNVILSPVIATWTAMEWAIRTAVTPVVNWVVNGRNTVKNTVTNARRSTFGRVFSKKPLSDFSYDKLNTADIIKKDKNRFSKLQFWKKSWNWTQVDKWSSNLWKVAAASATAATAWAATASAISSKEYEKMKAQIEWLKEDMDKLKKQKSDVEKKLAKALEAKKTDSKWKPEKPWKSEANTEWKSWDKWEKKEEDEKWFDSKDSKSKEVKEVKDEKKSDTKIESEKAWEKEWEKEKAEAVVEDAERTWILEKDSLWEKIFTAIKKDNPELKIVFDDSTWNWKVDWEWKRIIIWTKKPKEGSNLIAPFNEKMDMSYQKEHVLLHELSHIALDKNKTESKKLTDICTWKTLSIISKNKKYDTPEKKAKEDACEIFALYCRGWKNFEKYLDLLSADDKESQRSEKWLSKISKDEAEKIRKVCEALGNLYEKSSEWTKMAA